MQVSSPFLTDHAVARTLASLHGVSIRKVTLTLELIRREFGGKEPVAKVFSRCLPTATLHDSYRTLSLDAFWAKIEAFEREERETLLASFSAACNTDSRQNLFID